MTSTSRTFSAIPTAMPDIGFLDTDLKSVIDFYGRVVAGQAGPELTMACAESLERGLLDYSLESLHVVDRYLQSVRAAQEGIPTIAYANTIMGTAICVGVVIRRGAPAPTLHSFAVRAIRRAWSAMPT